MLEHLKKKHQYGGVGAGHSPISECALGANTSSEMGQTWPVKNTQGASTCAGQRQSLAGHASIDLNPGGLHFKR